MKLQLKQFVGSVVITASFGAGVAFADSQAPSDTATLSSTSQTVVSSSGNADVEVKTQSSQTVSSGSESSTTGTTASVETKPISSTEEASLDTGGEKKTEPQEVVLPAASGGSIEVEESGKSVVNTKKSSSPLAIPALSGVSLQYSATSILSDASTSPADPMSQPSPTDPFKGILNQFGVMAGVWLPAPPALIADFQQHPKGLPTPVALLAALVAATCLILIRSDYVALIKRSGFQYAPRSDAVRAIQFATPLKWVLSEVVLLRA